MSPPQSLLEPKGTGHQQASVTSRTLYLSYLNMPFVVFAHFGCQRAGKPAPGHLGLVQWAHGMPASLLCPVWIASRSPQTGKGDLKRGSIVLICTAHTGTLGKEGILILLFSYSPPPASHLCSPKGGEDKAPSVALPGTRNLWIQPIARAPGVAKVLKTPSVPVYPPPHPQLWPRRQFSSKHHLLLGGDGDLSGIFPSLAFWFATRAYSAFSTSCLFFWGPSWEAKLSNFCRP